MRRIEVVTDSVAALSPEIIKKSNIHVVPMLLEWDGKVYRDGVDITPGEVYRRMRISGDLPSFSTPPMGDFINIYTRLANQGKADEIISVHVSSKLSATYQAARLASDEAELSIPIQVIDTGTAAMAEGFAALEAARAAAEGADSEEVVRRVEEVSHRSHVFAMLETLEYVLRTGRVGQGVMRMVSSALSIKPIMRIDNGKVGLLCRPRTRRKALSFMLNEMEKQVGAHPVHVAVMHADAPDEAERLREVVANRFNCEELFTTEFSPVMGGAAGPGVVGLAFYDGDGVARNVEQSREERHVQSA